MSAHIQVSRGERAILTLLGLGVIGLIVVLALLNGIFTYIGWAPLNPDAAEIAVLVPDKQETPGKEIIEVANLGANRAYSELQAAGKTLQIRIHVYETGDNPNSAAWAAKIALRNPNTVAVIGPFDTRQSIAVAETLHDQNLAMITPDGLAPIVSPGNPVLDSVYHLSLPYTEQARLMPKFLHNQGWNDVYLIAEQTEYVQKVLEVFNPAANNTIKVVGTANITDTPAQEIVAEVKNLKPHALLYIGGPEQAITLLDEMNKEGKTRSEQGIRKAEHERNMGRGKKPKTDPGQPGVPIFLRPAEPQRNPIG